VILLWTFSFKLLFFNNNKEIFRQII